MKTYLLTTAAALGALSAMTLAAPAADLIEPPVYIEPQPLPVPVEEVSTAGWYIRGDVGYAFSSKTDGYYKYQRGYSTAHGYDIFLDQAHYESIETDDAFLISGGLGYRFNQFARVDLTADYFSTDLRGSIAPAIQAASAATTTPPTSISGPSWPTPMSISAPMAASRLMSAPASALRMSPTVR